MIQPYSRAIPPFASGTSLPPRDLEVLGYLAGFRCLSSQQLARLILRDAALAPASCEPVMRRVLRRLRAQGLITTRAALADRPRDARSVWAHLLTPGGRQVYSFRDARYPAEKLRTPGLSSLAHAILVADIALTIRDAVDRTAGSRMSWECDWETVARIGSTTVIPDALLTYDLEHRRVFAFIEADRATEHGPAFGRKVARYLALYRSDVWRASLPVWPLVLTVTPTPRRAEHLSCRVHDQVRRLGEPHMASRFRFTSFAELCGQLGPFGAIWRVAGEPHVHPPIDGSLDVPRGTAKTGVDD